MYAAIRQLIHRLTALAKKAIDDVIRHRVFHVINRLFLGKALIQPSTVIRRRVVSDAPASPKSTSLGGSLFTCFLCSHLDYLSQQSSRHLQGSNNCLGRTQEMVIFRVRSSSASFAS